MIEKIKEDFEFEMRKADCKLLFVEDAYRMQTFIDDFMRELEIIVERTDKLVKELEGMDNG